MPRKDLVDRKPIISNRVLDFPAKSNAPEPQPPPSAPLASGSRPAGRLLECRAELVIRQVIRTRDVRRIARNHGVTVREVVGLLVDRLERKAA
jgi:hypothetical protein